MIALLLLQVISIDGVYELYHRGDLEQAYRVSYQIEDTTGFYQDELIELRAMLSMHTQRFDKADSLFRIAINSEYKEIQYKAYVNYAELQHLTFNFDRRIRYLERAFDIKQTQKVIRIIARHHFQIEANYDKAQKWIDRHPTPQTDKDQAGFDLLQAEFAESKRQYSEAIRYYQQAKVSSHKAGLFNYELFSEQGLYRAERLKSNQFNENVHYLLFYLILTGAYYIGRMIYMRQKNEQANARTNY